MNIIQFTIPVAGDCNITLKEEQNKYFYPKLHRHEQIQLTWIQKGEGTLVINHETFTFYSNQIFCIGANQPHVFKSAPAYFSPDSNQKIIARSIFFDPNGKLKYLFELAEFKTVKQLLLKFNAGFAIPDNHVKEVSLLFNHIFQQSDTLKMLSFIELLHKMSNLNDIKKFSNSDKIAKVNEFDGIRISNIYHYIMMNYHNQLTLEQIAKEANMTPQAFCSYFKKRTSKTFINFLNEVRIHEACHRLTSNDFDFISDVGFKCGFNTITHFNRVFKSIKGISPTDYRSKYLGLVNSDA